MSLTSVRFREAWNFGGLTLRELAVRTYRQIDNHETLDRAAALAFYAMLSLVPFLGFLLVLAVGSRSGLSVQLLTLSHDFLPAEAATLVDDQIRKIQAASPVGLLSFSTVVLLWSASSVFASISDATNAAHGVRDSRPWWRRRVVAAFLTIVEVALLIIALASILAWPYVQTYIGFGNTGTTMATLVQWVVIVIALLATFAVAYYFGPDVAQEWEWITPGSALGVLVLIAASLGLRSFVRYGTNYSESYGALAGVILMLLWLYTASLALLVGAEINCVIEHAAAHGKVQGEKTVPEEIAKDKSES